MAAIWAGREAISRTGDPQHRPSIVVLDGARRLGAKILVAGGGRCNVTHHQVDESAYAGSSRNAIRKVLGRWGVDRTVEFFRELGVELKQEETGKLFPVTDDAHTVLNALLDETRRVGVQILFPWRVESIEPSADGLRIVRAQDETTQISPDPSGGTLRHAGALLARRVILATGGLALPKTGSDGKGFSIAQSLGHTLTPRIFPALVPLTLPKGHFLCELSGITCPATLELRSPTGKKLTAFTNSTLLTHFGLSGPSVLDISRYYTASQTEGGSPGADGGKLLINFLPSHSADSLDAQLAAAGRSGSITIARFLADQLPDRLLRALVHHARLDPASSLASLPKDARRRLSQTVTELPLPITGDRGYTFAEVTAGGIPLSEVNLATMESRICPGLYLCGEICDVDGRIGGFNFQWAWASGFVAGCSAATAEEA